VGNQTPESLLPAGLVLLSPVSSRATELLSLKLVQENRPKDSRCLKACSTLRPPTASHTLCPDPCLLQHDCTTLLEPVPGKQAPELLLSEGFVPLCLQQLPWLQVAQCQQVSLRAHTACKLGSLCLQQLPWLLETHALMQVEPKASAALWAPDNSRLQALLPHGYLQLVTQGQEPATAPLSEPQAPGFAVLMAPRGLSPHSAWRPSTTHCP
jgi:hypothetical protein